MPPISQGTEGGGQEENPQGQSSSMEEVLMQMGLVPKEPKEEEHSAREKKWMEILSWTNSISRVTVNMLLVVLCLAVIYCVLCLAWKFHSDALFNEAQIEQMRSPKQPVKFHDRNPWMVV